MGWSGSKILFGVWSSLGPPRHLKKAWPRSLTLFLCNLNGKPRLSCAGSPDFGGDSSRCPQTHPSPAADGARGASGGAADVGGPRAARAAAGQARRGACVTGAAAHPQPGKHLNVETFQRGRGSIHPLLSVPPPSICVCQRPILLQRESFSFPALMGTRIGALQVFTGHCSPRWEGGRRAE